MTTDTIETTRTRRMVLPPRPAYTRAEAGDKAARIRVVGIPLCGTLSGCVRTRLEPTTSFTRLSAVALLVLAGKSGRFRRRGAWRVPRVLKVESEYGKVDLDLSRAFFENPVVDIELQLRFGRARITLPRDAVVDIDELSTVWKQPIHKTPQRFDGGGPRIRISGTMEYGRLKIRHKAH